MDAKKWKVKVQEGNIYGPADTETIKRWFRENRISGEDYVSSTESEDWKKLSEISEFATAPTVGAKTGFLLPPAQERTLTTQVVSDAWEILKSNLFPIIGVFLLYVVIVMGVSIILRDRSLTLIRLLISPLIVAPLAAGLCWYCLGQIRKQEIGVSALFDGFKVFLPALGAYFLIYLFTILGFLFLIIPGIIVSLAFALTYFFIIDKQMGPWESMKASFDITKGFRWRILAIGMLCSLINILGLLCLGIGILVTAPIQMLAFAALYQRLSTGNIHESQKQTSASEFLLGGILPIIAILGMLAAIAIPAFLKGRENAIRVIRDANKSIFTESNKPIFTNPTEPILTRGNPIPTASYAYTDRRYREDKKNWRKEILIDNYNKYGASNPKWDSEVQYFLTDIVELMEGNWNRELVEDLKSTSSELMAIGCNDPFIVYLHGYLLYQSGKIEEAEPFVRKGLTMLENSNYPKICWYYAADKLDIIEEKLNRETEETYKHKLKYFSMALATADTDFQNGQKRLILEDFYSVWDGLSFESKEWLFNNLNKIPPTSDPWIAEMMKGYYYKDGAWEVRGSGVASTVKKEGWKGFKEGLEKAKESLTKAYKLHPEYPEAASKMIEISMGLNDSKSARMWFDRAVEAQIDHMFAYDCLLWFMRPRWGGSYEEMYAFGLECLNTKRFDTEVPRMFSKVVGAIGGELGDWRDAYRSPGVYENMQLLCEGFLNEPTRKERVNYFKTIYGIIAWATERYEDAKKLFDEIGNGIDIQAFQDFNSREELVVGEVYARTSFLKDDVQLAEKLFTENQSLEALPLFEKISDALKNDTMTLPYLHDRIVTLRFKKQLEKDEWVDFMPQEDFAGWSIDMGEWTVEDDGSVNGIPSGEELKLLCNTYIYGNFEIKGEIEAERNGGLTLNYYKYGWGNQQINFRISCREDKAYLSGNKVVRSAKPIICKDRNKFLLQVWDSHITAYINGQPVFIDQETNNEWSFSEKRQIGLWGWYGKRYSSTPVKFRNLQIRRLDTKP